MKLMHVVVHGKVQGVWYRAWTRDTAREMGVTGWVRNMDSGQVEAIAQAEDDVLEAFLERLYDGPPLARVTKIDISHPEKDAGFGTFKVRVEET